MVKGLNRESGGEWLNRLVVKGLNRESGGEWLNRLSGGERVK